MQVFVTGGAGFIGGYVVRALADAGHAVTVFDNESSGRLERVAAHAARVVHGDIRDWEAVRAATEGAEVVVHLAGLVGVPQSLADPLLNHAINVTGTFHVFEAARRAGVRRVVYASSASVYGSDPSLPKHEDGPIAPISPYAAAKRMTEVSAEAYCRAYPAIEFVGLRFMNVYGPGQDPASHYSGVIAIFCRNGLTGQPCVIFGDGQQTRDFVFVTDAAHATVLAATVPLPQRWCIFNVGSGQQTSLRQIVATLDPFLPAPIALRFAPPRAGDVRDSYADIRRITDVLGYVPQVSLPDGLRRTLDWAGAELAATRTPA